MMAGDCDGQNCRWATEAAIDLTPEQALERLEAVRMEVYRLQRDNLTGAAYAAAGEAKLYLYRCIDAVKAGMPGRR